VLLIIGGNGFVGGHVAARARAAGWHVLSASRRFPCGQGRRGTWPGLDLAAAPAADLERGLRDVAPGVVVNCAGVTSGDPARMAAANVVAVSRLVHAMTRATPGARLVHLGSAAEYGLVEVGTPVVEAAPACPVGAYGITKLAGTELVRAAAADGMNAVVLRLFNVIGPGTPPSTLPGRLVRDLRHPPSSGTGVVTGPLGAFRDFVDVRDAADAVLAAASAGADVPALINIGSGRATRLAEVAASLAAISGGARIKEVTQRAAGGGSPRSAQVPWQQADISRARVALGWSPATDLRESLRDMWEAAQ
jgi:NDP-hexose 4-ketoreductase